MPWETIFKLATALGVEYQARWRWKQRGKVPPRWHFPLVREAAKRGENLTMDDLQPPKRKAA